MSEILLRLGSKMPSDGKKNNRASGILFRIALALFIICVFVFAYICWTYFNGQREYDELKQYCIIEGKQLGDVSIDWDSLSSKNSDIVGWVYIPDTVVSYPIVWRENDDRYYLYHNFNNRSTKFGAEYGCIFLSGNNKKDWSSNSNFIFGHNMWNGSVFSVFSDEQANSEWFNNHRVIYVFTPRGNYKLSTYAQNKVSGNATDIVYTSFSDTQQLRSYAKERINSSIVTTNEILDTSNYEKLFSFSTCSSPDDYNRIVTFSYVMEYYDFTDSSKNVGIQNGTKGSIVTNEITNKVSDDTLSRQN